MINVIDSHVLYENPVPHLRSRHGYFPGVIVLPDGDLLAAVVIGEAFEAVDLTTTVLRSRDLGRSWESEQPILNKERDFECPLSDCLKATRLSDGTLIGMGYAFLRRDPDQGLSNPDTDGVQPGHNLVVFSTDAGRTWSAPRLLALSRPELLEISGPCILLENADLLAAGTPMPVWDGSQPSGNIGVLLRSRDQGLTWDDSTVYFRTAPGQLCPLEARLCEMQPGRIAALVWAVDRDRGCSVNNHVTVSTDSGCTWSDPIDTGVPGQASGLLWLAGDQLLTIHAQREGDVGLFVRAVTLAGTTWRVHEEKNIWNRAAAAKIGTYAEMTQNLRFGQPSLTRLPNNDILAVHWAVEQGQGRILAHRLRLGQ